MSSPVPLTSYADIYIALVRSHPFNKAKAFQITPVQIKHMSSAGKVDQVYKRVVELLLWSLGCNQKTVDQFFPRDMKLIQDIELYEVLRERIQRIQEISEGLQAGKSDFEIREKGKVKQWWLSLSEGCRERSLKDEETQLYEFMDNPLLMTRDWKRLDRKKVRNENKRRLDGVTALFNFMQTGKCMGQSLDLVTPQGKKNWADATATLYRTALYWGEHTLSWKQLLLLWGKREKVNQKKVDALLASSPIASLRRDTKVSITDPVPKQSGFLSTMPTPEEIQEKPHLAEYALTKEGLPFSSYVAFCTLATFERLFEIEIPTKETSDCVFTKEQFAISFELNDSVRAIASFFTQNSERLLTLEPADTYDDRFLKSLRIYHYMQKRWGLLREDSLKTVRQHLFDIVFTRNLDVDGEFSSFFPFEVPKAPMLTFNYFSRERKSFLGAMGKYEKMKERNPIAISDRFFVLMQLLRNRVFVEQTNASHEEEVPWNLGRWFAFLRFPSWEKGLSLPFPIPFKEKCIEKMNKSAVRRAAELFPSDSGMMATAKLNPQSPAYFLLRTLQLFAQMDRSVKIAPAVRASLFTDVYQRSKKEEINWPTVKEELDRFPDALSSMQRLLKGEENRSYRFLLLRELMVIGKEERKWLVSFAESPLVTMGSEELRSLLRYPVAHLRKFHEPFSKALDARKFRSVGKGLYTLFVDPLYFNAEWKKECVHDFLRLVGYGTLTEIDGEKFFTVFRWFLEKKLTEQHFAIVKQYRAYFRSSEPLYSQIASLSLPVLKTEIEESFLRHCFGVFKSVAHHGLTEGEQLQLLFDGIQEGPPFKLESHFAFVATVEKNLGTYLDRKYARLLLLDLWLETKKCRDAETQALAVRGEVEKCLALIKPIFAVRQKMSGENATDFTMPPTLLASWEEAVAKLTLELPRSPATTQLVDRFENVVTQMIAKIKQQLRLATFSPIQLITDCFEVRQVGFEGVRYGHVQFNHEGMTFSLASGAYAVVNWRAPLERVSSALILYFFNVWTMRGSWMAVPIDLPPLEKQPFYFPLLQALAKVVMEERTEHPLKEEVTLEKLLHSHPKAKEAIDSIVGLEEEGLVKRTLSFLACLKVGSRNALWGMAPEGGRDLKGKDSPVLVKPKVVSESLGRERKGALSVERRCATLRRDVKGSPFYSTEEITSELLEKAEKFVLEGSKRSPLVNVHLTSDGKALCTDYSLYMEHVASKKATHKMISLSLESIHAEGVLLFPFQMEYLVSSVKKDLEAFRAQFQMHVIAVKAEFYFWRSRAG